jgi:glutathione-regulated potassium-efflux system ancillary protein KefF
VARDHALGSLMVLVVHAHPYPARSVAGAELLAALRGLPDLEVRSLYQLYPDFDIDAEAERRALERARLVVLLHPLYWYSVPALLKQWFDVVLVRAGPTARAGRRSRARSASGR